MDFPFWDRISENGKKALAVIAVLQAIHFIVAVPLGIYDGWRWNDRFEHSVWQLKSIAVTQAVVSQIKSNEHLPYPEAVGGYKEDCHAALDDIELYGVSRQGCDGLPSLTQIVSDKVALYELSADDVGYVVDELDILYGIDPAFINLSVVLAQAMPAAN